MAKLPSAVEKLIDGFSQLPGVGSKSAARMVFYLLHSPSEKVVDFAEQIRKLKEDIAFCSICHNITDSGSLCSICDDEKRATNQIMVVEDVLDLFAFERVGDYAGQYHVLGGVISPAHGIGPSDINLSSLFSRVSSTDEDVELIIATNPTLEGEATGMYIRDELSESESVAITRIARGLPTGADLDYADRATLQRAFSGRTSL